MTFDHLEKIVPGISQIEMFMSDRILEDLRGACPLSGQKIVGCFDVGRFDPGAHDAEVTHHGFESDVGRFPGGKLPDLETSAAPYVQGQDGMAAMHHITGISGHVSGFGGLFKDGDIHPEMATIPVEGFLCIADANTDLLDAGDGGVLFLGHVCALTGGYRLFGLLLSDEL